MADKTWEYLVLRLNDDEEEDEQAEALNKLGEKGWELVAVIPTAGWDGQGTATRSTAYLKRLT